MNVVFLFFYQREMCSTVDFHWRPRGFHVSEVPNRIDQKSKCHQLDHTNRNNSEQKFALVSLSLTWSWWRHQMETFSALLAICAGNSPVTGEFPSQKPVTWSLMFSLLCAWQNGLQSRYRWFETPTRSFWRHCNEHRHKQSLLIQFYPTIHTWQ